MNTKSVDTVFRSVANYLVMLHSPLLDVCQLRLLQQIVEGTRRVEYGDMSDMTVRFEKLDIDAKLTLTLSVDHRNGNGNETTFFRHGDECALAPVKVRVNWCSSGSCSVKEAAALLEVYKDSVRICSMVQQLIPDTVSYVVCSAAETKAKLEAEEQGLLVAFAEKYGPGLRVGQKRSVDINHMPVKVPVGEHGAVLTAKHAYHVAIGGNSVTVQRTA